jgi:two-component system, LytTR family, sensor histidine kinase AlgZ
MPTAQSINQNHRPDALPNFRNMGVVLRAVLLTNGVMLLIALAGAGSMADFFRRAADISALLQPVLLTSLLLLFSLSPLLAQLKYRQGAAAMAFLAALVTFAIYRMGGIVYDPTLERENFHALANAVTAAGSALLLLGYFRLRALSLSPALQDARLQALRARIRPHFLFNTINAVLSIVRADPKRAETALEDMSDLFRMAMENSADLVPLKEEIRLARQYLALEELRLGGRLKVNWRIENVPEDALLPPLMLQPLLENAVYHGIEPLDAGGEIDIRLRGDHNDICLEIYNPRREQGAHHQGNKMALSNIRERLSLQFDIEARYHVEAGQDFYRVEIVLPYLKS